LLDGAFEQQCVYEGLGEVAAQLALGDVELSERRPGGPQAARFRSNQRAAVR
jgi:hypothetical protein